MFLSLHMSKHFRTCSCILLISPRVSPRLVYLNRLELRRKAPRSFRRVPRMFTRHSHLISGPDGLETLHAG